MEIYRLRSNTPRFLFNPQKEYYNRMLITLYFNSDGLSNYDLIACCKNIFLLKQIPNITSAVDIDDTFC